MECAGYRSLGLACVRAFMFISITMPAAPGGTWICVRNKYRCCGDAKRSETCGEIVGCIVEPCSSFAEIKVALIAVPDHRVECIDGLVGHGKRNTAQRKVKDRCNNAIRGAFGECLDERPADPTLVERFSIAAYNAS